MRETEITAPVDLCLPDGRLNPGAVGWTRRPLHRANLRGWGRTKRWEYWGVVTPRHIVGLVASSLDYAAVQSVYVLDRATGEETGKDAVVPFARGAVFPDRSGAGEASVRGREMAVGVRQGRSGSRVRAVVPGVLDLDVRVPLPDGHESLGVVVPWSSRRFQYTVKDVGRPVHGRLRLPSGEHEIGEGASWTITGPRVEAEFHPFHVRAARTELGVVGTDTHQCFGEFTGRARADDGTWIALDGLTGWAEESRQRW
ncbi:DUF2804 domain-containing protein [Actinomadura syzygii]|uniref:DUF2804 domain-containing protein n=1 Tax=Actinomadura syzygii TaxID=1427538 RepID=A0A5D0U489_9ACTN|nr:DUF2804 domain-containing protein [Actinomadura syzygii]TYC12452.1 DUF2804 domain-containing protein [Actinomadura syzygii]